MMYSEEQYYKALESYEAKKSATKTLTILGYPAHRQTLYNLINIKWIPPEEKSTFRGYHTEDSPQHPPLEQKLQVLHRCFEMGEDVQSVSYLLLSFKLLNLSFFSLKGTHALNQFSRDYNIFLRA